MSGHVLAQSPLSPADLQFTFAARLMQEKDAELAAEAFGDFVRDYADDARVGDAHYYLAILKRRQGDRAGAMAELKSANKLKYVTAAAAGVLRGQLMLEDGDATGAVAVLEAVDEKQLSDTPGSVAAWRYLLGAAYRGAGNVDAAAKQFAAAAQAPAPAPGNGNGSENGDSSVREMALVELAKTWIQRKEWEKAMGVLEKVVGEDSTSAKPQAALGSKETAEALQLAGAVAERLGRWKQAGGYYRRIVERHQSSAEFGDAAAGWLRAMFNEGDDAGVAAHAAELGKLVNGAAKAGVDYWHAAALIQLKRYGEARGVCARHSEREAASGPGPGSDGDLRYLDAVAMFHLDAGKFRGWYDGTDAGGFSAAQRDHLLYLRAEAEQDALRAIGMLGGLIEREDSQYAKAGLLLRAKLYERAGRKNQAAEDYARYAGRYANDGQAEAAMGYAVDLAMAGGEYERAVGMIRGIAKPQAAPGSKTPGSVGLQLKLAVALIQLGRNEEAGKVLNEVLAAKAGGDAGTRALAMYYKGLLLIPPEVKEGGDITAAVEMMTRAMAGDLPGDQRLEAMAVTARLQRMAGQTEQALKTYQQLRDLDPKNFRGFDGATALWVGQGLLDGGDAKAAAGWFEAAGESAKKEDALWAAAMFGQARAEQRLGQYDKAVEHYRELLGYSGSYGERGRLGLAQSLAATGQRDAAMEEYNGLLSAAASEVAATALTDSALLEAAAADRCERTGDAAGVKEHRKEARRRLSRVVILYNQEELGGLPVRAMVLLGRMEEAEGMTEKARGRYEMAGKGEDAEIAKPQAAPAPGSLASDERAWRMVGRGELKRMDGQVGDALFLWGKVVKEDGAGDAGRYAKQRLALLGGKP
ncbi:MAG: tetratricopeptide repeat protein [Phycisphaerales bacterium]